MPLLSEASKLMLACNDSEATNSSVESRASSSLGGGFVLKAAASGFGSVWYAGNRLQGSRLGSYSASQPKHLGFRDGRFGPVIDRCRASRQSKSSHPQRQSTFVPSLEGGCSLAARILLGHPSA